MDGTFDEIDPDEVEAEVGNLWRTLYKLEKTFANQANPEAMAQKVRTIVISSVQKFMFLIQIVQIDEVYWLYKIILNI